MQVSVLITTYRRPDHLRWCLESLCRQDLDCWEHEIVVLNDAIDDDGTRELVERHAGRGARYLFTGQRNRDGMVWRVPGFAFNIGIRQTTGEIVVLSSSDIYHLGSTIVPIVQPLLNYHWLLGTVKQVLDDDGSLIDYLRREGEGPELTSVIERIRERKPDQCPQHFVPLPDVPYLLAVRREHLMYLGGYDEDFLGYACDDTDLMERLVSVGCEYLHTKAECVHLFHGRRRSFDEINRDLRYQYNLSLMSQRRRQPRRNIKREWGRLE